VMTRNEYATLVYYWAGHPQPERIPEILATLEHAEWTQYKKSDLPIAGAVAAFESLYPDRAQEWRKGYPTLHRRVSAAVGLSKECPEWTDFHLAQWFILSRESSIDAVLDRVADGGTVGMEAQISLQKLASDSTPFRKALEKAREARKLAMLIQ